MSAFTKNAVSIRKRPTQESILPTNGGKILCFQHEATGGETSIDLTALVVPTSLVGFSNPALSDLLGAHLSVYPSSMSLMSSLGYPLQKDVTWRMSGPSTITLIGYTMSAGEIITGIIHATNVEGILVSDARAVVATGTLTAGQDTIVTDPFVVNKYSTTQLGDVLVFLNGALQMRNVNNATAAPSADGNYQELPVAGGLTNQIKLNNAVGVDTPYVVVSNGLVAERPTGSMLAAVEVVQGQVDQLIPAVEALLGTPGVFGPSPSNVDLQSFGQTVLAHEARLAKATANGYQYNWSVTNAGTSGVYVDHPDGVQAITLPKAGIYKVYLNNVHNHSNAYEGLDMEWSFGGTATRVDNGQTMNDWGDAATDGNGANTIVAVFQATAAGQTVTLRPRYRVTYAAGTGANHTFRFSHLVERWIAPE